MPTVLSRFDLSGETRSAARNWCAVVLCGAACSIADARAARGDDSDSASEPPSAFLAGTRLWGAVANHGPGTSGGGLSTPSGETLKAGAFSLDLREDFSQFEHFDRDAAELAALNSDSEFDALQYSFVTTAALSYGITDDLQVGVQIGYYVGQDFISAEPDGAGGVESGVGNPAGLMDTWFSAKYRVMKGAPGNLSIIGGFKLPTGKDDIRLSNGELMEASSQPGTGAFDFQAGLGYSRFLTERMTIDAGGLYTLRTEHDDFKVGDRVEGGIDLAYRLTEAITTFPQWSVFGELTVVYLQKDKQSGVSNENSGGTTIYLTPGGRARFSEHVALTVAPSFPVFQDLNGEQDKIQWKLSATLSFSF